MNLPGYKRVAYLRFFLLATAAVLNAGLLVAQTGARVRLPRQAASMQEVVREIERQTG